MTISLLIFDLDGTLIDSAPDLCTAVGLALGDFGLPPPPLQAVRSMIGDGQRVLSERALRHAGSEPTPEQIDAVLARYRYHYGRHLVEQTTCYPGVPETLRALALPQGVATNKPGMWAREIVARLGIAGTLRWVLGEDDVGQRKPDPLIVHRICAAAGVPPQEVLYVGDSAVDLRTARAAGAIPVVCTYGYGAEAALAALREEPPEAPEESRPVHLPVHLIDRFSELLPLVASLQQGPGHATMKGR